MISHAPCLAKVYALWSPDPSPGINPPRSYFLAADTEFSMKICIQYFFYVHLKSLKSNLSLLALWHFYTEAKERLETKSPRYLLHDIIPGEMWPSTEVLLSPVRQPKQWHNQSPTWWSNEFSGVTCRSIYDSEAAAVGLECTERQFVFYNLRAILFASCIRQVLNSCMWLVATTQNNAGLKKAWLDTGALCWGSY